MKRFSVITLILGSLMAMISFWASQWVFFTAGIVLAGVGAAVLILDHFGISCLERKTALTAIGAAASVALGVLCNQKLSDILRASNFAQRTVAYPAAMSGMLIALAGALCFLIFYIVLRVKNPSGRGTAMELAAAAAYVAPCYLFFMFFWGFSRIFLRGYF